MKVKIPLTCSPHPILDPARSWDPLGLYFVHSFIVVFQRRKIGQLFLLTWWMHPAGPSCCWLLLHLLLVSGSSFLHFKHRSFVWDFKQSLHANEAFLCVSYIWNCLGSWWFHLFWPDQSCRGLLCWTFQFSGRRLYSDHRMEAAAAAKRRRKARPRINLDELKEVEMQERNTCAICILTNVK